MTDNYIIKNETFSIDRIIAEELVYAEFQPIISIRKKQIIGVEALSRGIDPVGGGVISPPLLIRSAAKAGLSLELDRLFRKKIFELFKPCYKKKPDLLLSVNLDSSAVQMASGSGHFLSSVINSGLDPSCIIIEILESEVEDFSLLEDFVREHRKEGFMIALDDFGAGFSNWDRIIRLKPDLIKLDRSIVNEIDKDFFRQEGARSLIRLAHSTGALVIAEGVEREEEALKSVELNADLFQGFLYSPPVNIEAIHPGLVSKRIEATSSGFIEMKTQNRKNHAEELKKYNSICNRILADLENLEIEVDPDPVSIYPYRYPEIECIYILNKQGVQITDTFVNSGTPRRSAGRIFYPDEKFTDQSSKDYFFYINNGSERYISDPYISSATGNRCITISRVYKDSKGNRRILCIDLTRKLETG